MASPVAPAKPEPNPEQDLYRRLAAPFDTVFEDVRGGVKLTYITGQQVIERLNEVCGVGGWTFQVVQTLYQPEVADEVLTHGRLRIRAGYNQDGTANWVEVEQWGSQKVRRTRNTNAVAELGFDYKGSATDAHKKCAMSFGVGLYLSKKDEGLGVHVDVPDPNALYCERCANVLNEITFGDGTIWTPQQLSARTKEKYGQSMCMQCYKLARDADRAAATQPAAPVAQPEPAAAAVATNGTTAATDDGGW